MNEFRVGCPPRRGLRSVARMGFACGIVLLLVAGALLELQTPSAAASLRNKEATAVPKGWAPGGSDTAPENQYTADIADLASGGCGDNAALLFRVRGSGAEYGGYPVAAKGDQLGAWLIGAGQELIRRGWRVRGLQAIYPAPPLPSGKQMVNPAAWKAYRDVATKSAPTIVDELVAAHRRCPARSILVAGHSQGNIVLRIALKQLPEDVLARIARIDLFSDPTADGAVDKTLQHPADLDGRLTNSGVDTAAARLAWKAGTFAVAGGVNFRQKPYPIQSRVYQYCVPYDVVCDVNPVNISKATADSDKMGKIHVSYAFASVGKIAARTLKNYVAPDTIPKPKLFNGSRFVVRPGTIGSLTCANNSEFRMKWTSWTASRAVGQGTTVPCRGSAARIDVTVTRVVKGVFTRMKISYRSGGGGVVLMLAWGTLGDLEWEGEDWVLDPASGMRPWLG